MVDRYCDVQTKLLNGDRLCEYAGCLNTIPKHELPDYKCCYNCYVKRIDKSLSEAIETIFGKKQVNKTIVVKRKRNKLRKA